MSLTADSSRQEQIWRLQQENKSLLVEVDQWRLAAELARDQSAMLIKSLDILTSDSPLDTFLGHVLKTTVDQLEAVGGTLWFPDQASGTAPCQVDSPQALGITLRPYQREGLAWLQQLRAVPHRQVEHDEPSLHQTMRASIVHVACGWPSARSAGRLANSRRLGVLGPRRSRPHCVS